jgi:hypothetical protein
MCTSMKRTGKEKAVSYSVHRRVWVATYSLVYWQLKLPKYFLIMRRGFRVPGVDHIVRTRSSIHFHKLGERVYLNISINIFYTKR